jgi:uncharacterized protein (DUF983 family)
MINWGFTGFLFPIYLTIVVIGVLNTFIAYQRRLLVKANFWISVATFCLIAFITLLMLFDAVTI